MSVIERQTASGPVTGTCDPRFAGVLDAFVENFAHRGELGASLCLTIEGRSVVDLWGGARTLGGDPWTEDTLCVVYSSTKGASALCAHVAADRGQLDLDAPVVRYWPEFGAEGKDAAQVSMMLDHSVGVPAIREPLPKGSVYDYDYMCQR
ncbi:MAG TPA: serine hydrolase domain-containing protein, partial [Caulobacteraceae bacterium]|nr:serine hydrolase domain-containing protein [Caulobacteraceae bacterium]